MSVSKEEIERNFSSLSITRAIGVSHFLGRASILASAANHRHLLFGRAGNTMSYADDIAAVWFHTGKDTGF